MGTAEIDLVGQARLAAFRQALTEFGWMQGRNVRVEYRWSGGDIGRVRAYAAELVGFMPNVILANTTPAAAALKQATRSIPIVFAVVNDPVEQGLVSCLAYMHGGCGCLGPLALASTMAVSTRAG
jgi:putative ABC transport system substrate-binding protein